MDKMRLINNLFSIENAGNHLTVCILGIKLKIRQKFKINEKLYKYKIENDKIFFNSFTNSYACNPKYIAEEILRRNLPYKIVWGVHKNTYLKDFPKEIKIVESGTKEYLKEFATSKILVFNNRLRHELDLGLYKKNEQIYIQTWHGSLGIKKTGVDTGVQTENIKKDHMIDAQTIDYLTSNSTFTDNLFKTIFFNNGKILKVGHPRNDIFFNLNKEKIQQIKEKIGLKPKQNVVMYAPTFRDGDCDIKIFSLDLISLKNALIKKFGGNWIVLTRLHPRLIKLKEKFEKTSNGEFTDVTIYPDMQELLVISDIVITDYSSCIYDFMLTRKPGFIFATDVEKYNNTRGLYYPLESTPFPVARNNDEMIKNIENFDENKYKADVESFLKEKGCMEDGNASKRVVDLIEKIIEGKKI